MVFPVSHGASSRAKGTRSGFAGTRWRAQDGIAALRQRLAQGRKDIFIGSRFMLGFVTSRTVTDACSEKERLSPRGRVCGQAARKDGEINGRYQWTKTKPLGARMVLVPVM